MEVLRTQTNPTPLAEKTEKKKWQWASQEPNWDEPCWRRKLRNGSCDPVGEKLAARRGNGMTWAFERNRGWERNEKERKQGFRTHSALQRSKRLLARMTIHAYAYPYRIYHVEHTHPYETINTLESKHEMCLRNSPFCMYTQRAPRSRQGQVSQISAAVKEDAAAALRVCVRLLMTIPRNLFIHGYVSSHKYVYI